MLKELLIWTYVNTSKMQKRPQIWICTRKTNMITVLHHTKTIDNIKT